MKIETYLKDYLTQKDIQIGLKDIRTHYNAKKGDIMFTFYTIEPSQREAFNKKYFYIDDNNITIYLNEPTSIKCSTNMNDSEIEVTYTDNISGTYENKKIDLVGTRLGTGKIYVNGEEKAEVIIKERPNPSEDADIIEISKRSLALQIEQTYQLNASTNIDNPLFT